MNEGWLPDMGRLVVIGHGDCPEDAEQLRQAVLLSLIHILGIVAEQKKKR